MEGSAKRSGGVRLWVGAAGKGLFCVGAVWRDSSVGRCVRWTRPGLVSRDGVPLDWDCGWSWRGTLLAKDRLDDPSMVGELMVRPSLVTGLGFNTSVARIGSARSVCERAAAGSGAAAMRGTMGVVELRPELAVLLRCLPSSRCTSRRPEPGVLVVTDCDRLRSSECTLAPAE